MNCQNCVYFKKGKEFKSKGRGTKTYTTYFVSCMKQNRLISRKYLESFPKKCGSYKEKQ